MTTSALVTLLQHIDIKHTDKIAPVIGEPFLFPTTGFLHIWHEREGVPGQFHLAVKVEHVKPFVNPNLPTKESENV